MSFTVNQQIVVDLFIAAYGRTPTQNALDFFVSKLDTEEMTSSSITNFMLDATNNREAEQRYPINLATSDKIEKVFHNILGRGTATPEGLDFWVSKVENEPNYTMSNLIEDILIASKSQSDDAQILKNKSDVTQYFLDNVPISQQSTTQVNLDNVIDIDSVNLAEKEINLSSKSNINSGYGELSNYDTKGVVVVDGGKHWNEELTTISFSFNDSMPNEYNSFDGLTDNWKPLKQEERDATRQIIDGLNKIIDVQLVELPDKDGQIRFSMVDMSDNTAGFTFLPRSTNAGDIFLSNDFDNRDTIYDFGLKQGENGFLTIAHELGHAMGLQHPFDSPLVNTITDDTYHSIMSYTSINDNVANFSLHDSTILFETKNITPDLYSLYDVSALQAIYGANTSTATEDNIYKTEYTDYEIQTIWDAGGRDKIDLSSTKGDSTIDLHGGTINSADQYSVNQIINMHQDAINKSSVDDWIKKQILGLENSHHLYTGENNLTIAQGVIIEDISTGSGDDIITDNEVNNIISTGAGDDIIHIGSGGKDYVDGGIGTDFLYLDIDSNNIDIEKSEDDTYILIADDFIVEFENIEHLHFSDNSTFDPDTLV